MPKTVLAVLPLASRICAGQCTATTPEFHHRHPTWPDDELSPSVSGSILWRSFDVKGLGLFTSRSLSPLGSFINRCRSLRWSVNPGSLAQGTVERHALRRSETALRGEPHRWTREPRGKKRCCCALVATLPSHFGCRLGAETGARRRHGLAGSRLLLRSCRRSRRVHN